MGSERYDWLTAGERALYNLMSQYSEDYWAAGWYSGIEEIIWDALQGGSQDPDLIAIRSVAVWLHKWIVWDDGPRAVDIEEYARQRGQTDGTT